MGTIIKEFKTKYDVGDVVIFRKNDRLEVGMIEGYYVDEGEFWFNIRTSRINVYSYSNKGDIAEFDIIDKVTGELRELCINALHID